MAMQLLVAVERSGLDASSLADVLRPLGGYVCSYIPDHTYRVVAPASAAADLRSHAGRLQTAACNAQTTLQPTTTTTELHAGHQPCYSAVVAVQDMLQGLLHSRIQLSLPAGVTWVEGMSQYPCGWRLCGRICCRGHHAVPSTARHAEQTCLHLQVSHGWGMSQPLCGWRLCGRECWHGHPAAHSEARHALRRRQRSRTFGSAMASTRSRSW